MLGWEQWLRFATCCDALTHEEADTIMSDVRGALAELVARTQGQVADQEPAARFVTRLAAVLSTGRAHLLALEGGTPANPQRWGWRGRTIGDDVVMEPLTREHIGWIEGEDVYLDPDASYAAVQQLAREGGVAFGLGPQT
jgi:hypothetical protein